MNLELFVDSHSGQLVPISGSDPRFGTWEHAAFVPNPPPDMMPALSGRTIVDLTKARAALAALDSTAQRLPNPGVFRHQALRKEAQSTSALEGTYAPLSVVLTADDEDAPTGDLREILNYVTAAEQAFAWVADGRPLTVAMIEDLQRMLVRSTRADTPSAGQVRDIQVVIGQAAGHPVRDSRFVPHPPGDELSRRVRELTDWMSLDHSESIDPVVKAAFAHYQFETLHPFNDGNGRIGRLLVVLQLLQEGVLSEPTLTVSPWFEARRPEYYDRLFSVSAKSEWDAWIRFFATGLEDSARSTLSQINDLMAVQDQLHEEVRRSSLRAGSAHAVVDFAVARPTFTINALRDDLALSYGRANTLVKELSELGILESVPGHDSYRRRFRAPAVLEVLLRS